MSLEAFFAELRVQNPWREFAACKGRPTEWWMPSHPGPADPRAVILCGRCAVRRECRAWAIKNKEHGYWGGLSHRARRAA